MFDKAFEISDQELIDSQIIIAPDNPLTSNQDQSKNQDVLLCREESDNHNIRKR